MKGLTTLLITAIILLMTACESTEVRDYYQIKIYQIESDKQESTIDNYLKNAYLPALHRAGIEKAGVFKPIEGLNDVKDFIMVFIPFSSLQEFDNLSEVLANDETYQNDGRDYIQASHDDAPYVRIESMLLKSFSAMPLYAVPELSSNHSQRVYEFRSYEGATELLYERKVEMFNDAGEVALFQELEFNPVFFAEVLSSAHMPHLIYMTAFSDTLSQQAHWDAFRAHPAWLEMKDLDRYQNTVSSITRYLLYPTDYSDI